MVCQGLSGKTRLKNFKTKCSIVNGELSIVNGCLTFRLPHTIARLSNKRRFIPQTSNLKLQTSNLKLNTTSPPPINRDTHTINVRRGRGRKKCCHRSEFRNIAKTFHRYFLLHLLFYLLNSFFRFFSSGFY